MTKINMPAPSHRRVTIGVTLAMQMLVAGVTLAWGMHRFQVIQAEKTPPQPQLQPRLIEPRYDRPDVVDDEQQRVLIRVQLDDQYPQQRPGCQIEGDGDVLLGQPPGLGLARLGGQRREVHPDKRQADRRLDDHPRPPVLRRESAPQGLVPAHDLPERSLELLDVKSAAQTQGRFFSREHQMIDAVWDG